MRLVLSLVLVLVAVALASAEKAVSPGCFACHNVVNSLRFAAHGTPLAVANTLRGTGSRSLCSHASSALHAACNSLVGHLGDNASDVLASAVDSGDNSAACNAMCDSDMLFELGGGALRADAEDLANTKKTETEAKKENDSPLQKDNADDAEARRRKEVAEAKAEAEKKAAAEIKKVTDTMEAKTKEAVAEATAKAVKETEEKLRLSFTTRKWPVNVSVPKEASKLACTEESLGRMAFRENNFFGCKTHCVDVCNQCNCRQEESVVADPDCGGCEKRVKREVCDQCCSQKCAPEWLNFADCSRQCESCDCKEEKGIKICQQCCKEKCQPKWVPDPI